MKLFKNNFTALGEAEPSQMMRLQLINAGENLRAARRLITLASRLSIVWKQSIRLRKNEAAEGRRGIG